MNFSIKTKGNDCKQVTGLFNQTVNHFQDEVSLENTEKPQQITTIIGITPSMSVERGQGVR